MSDAIQLCRLAPTCDCERGSGWALSPFCPRYPAVATFRPLLPPVYGGSEKRLCRRLSPTELTLLEIRGFHLIQSVQHLLATGRAVPLLLQSSYSGSRDTASFGSNTLQTCSFGSQMAPEGMNWVILISGSRKSTDEDAKFKPTSHSNCPPNPMLALGCIPLTIGSCRVTRRVPSRVVPFAEAVDHRSRPRGRAVVP